MASITLFCRAVREGKLIIKANTNTIYFLVSHIVLKESDCNDTFVTDLEYKDKKILSVPVLTILLKFGNY